MRTVASSATYLDGTWHHAAAILSGAGMVLYVDGTLVASDPATTTAQAFTETWRFGCGNLTGWTAAPTNFFYTGTFAYGAVYTTALTAAPGPRALPRRESLTSGAGRTSNALGEVSAETPHADTASHPPIANPGGHLTNYGSSGAQVVERPDVVDRTARGRPVVIRVVATWTRPQAQAQRHPAHRGTARGSRCRTSIRLGSTSSKCTPTTSHYQRVPVQALTPTGRSIELPPAAGVAAPRGRLAAHRAPG